MIEDWDSLREAFLMLKIPAGLHEIAMDCWEDAINNPTPALIWKFYCCSGMNRYFIELQVNWGLCHRDWAKLNS